MEIFDPAKLGIACKVPGNVLDTAALLHWHYFDRGERKDIVTEHRFPQNRWHANDMVIVGRINFLPAPEKCV